MPPPRFQHGYAHDVFLSYTHVDDQPEAGRRWVTQFARDLKVRLEMVSGHTIDIWRDEEKMGAADRFNDTIAAAVKNAAVLLVVLSPSYFRSDYCSEERVTFHRHAADEGKAAIGTKSRIVKVAKFHVDLEAYPADLRELLEYRFYTDGIPRKEFHLSDDPTVRYRYFTRVDDVAQEIASLLVALEPAAAAVEAKKAVYLAEATSDLETSRDDLRRHLVQLGYDVLPRRELRLLPARELREFVADAIGQSCLVVHPVGAYYGTVPEGADGKSVVQIQLEVAQQDRRDGDLGRIIWVPEGLTAQEPSQRAFLDQIRKEYAGNRFELVERPFRALAIRVADRLKAVESGRRDDVSAPVGVYVVCANPDRALAKTVRSFLFNLKWPVEWTPIAAASGNLADSADHQRLLRRNRAHLVLHGATDDAWIQDRIRELDDLRRQAVPPPVAQAIYLSDPRRDDKDDILAADIGLLTGYGPAPVAEALKLFVDNLAARPGRGGA